MREISLHILDIVQNSIAAGASRIEVVVAADTLADRLTISIKDNGRGMSDETIKWAMNPFWTTRTTRKVGLGIPMFTAAAEACDGRLKIDSELGCGTTLEVEFRLSHIDRAPFGDIVMTVVDLIVANPAISFKFEQTVDGETALLDTNDIRRELGEVPIETPEVRQWMKAYLAENIARVGRIQ
jgi:hypothetical protein